MSSAYQFNWSLITGNWNLFVIGAWTDLWVSAVGFVLACSAGLGAALMLLSRSRLVTAPAFAFVQMARGVPPYVFLLWVHFGLAALIDVAFTPLQSIILVLAITGGGYTAEIFRSGILAVEPGQVEAARSLGMTRMRVYGDVILPQALRIIVPPLGNIWIGLLKTATLMGVIAVPDLLYYAQSINMNYFAPFEAFSAVVVIFVSIVFCVSLFVAGLEKAISHP
jgi:His/Glu/Gln/Arg/opine family amino acid ABC transporter permease subunit